MKLWNKKIFLLLAVLFLNGLFFYSVKAATDNENINVQLVIPGGGSSGCGSNCPRSDITPPVIYSVVTSTSQTTASVSWSASDDMGLSSITFDYGTTMAYGQTAHPSGEYNYVASLQGLATGTIYYFKITAVDTSNNGVNFTGSFQTTGVAPPSDHTPPTISNVVSSTTHNTASVSWSASDNIGIASLIFDYGTTVAYGQTAVPSGSYVVSLSGLTTNTVYYFKITVADIVGNDISFTGSFKTEMYGLEVVGPIISDITVTPGVNLAVVNFLTDKDALAQINYGETTSLGSSAVESHVLSTRFAITLLGLLPNKTYYYKVIATDADQNSSATSIFNFKTLSDDINPPDVSNLQISTGLSSFTLTWKNPLLSFTPDFAGVKILRKIGSQASGPSDSGATVVYDGYNETVIDGSVLSGFTYFYTAFSHDTAGNFSSGNFVSGKIDVIVHHTAEICNNSIDDNGDGRIDCTDILCTDDVNCKTTDLPEPLIIGGATPACSDEKDNDSDGLVDFPADPGCSNLQDSDEYNPPTATVPEFEKLTLDKLKFFAGSHQIELTIKAKTVSGLAGSNLSIGIKKTSLIGEPKSLILRVGDTDQHQFNFDSSNNTYYADVLFPQNGKSQAYIEINYGAGQIDSLGVDLQAVGLGKITDGKNNNLAGVEVILRKENGDTFPAQIYGQKNPQTTNSDALVGWMVPNGRYYITATKNGFYEYSGPFFSVVDNIINTSINLVVVPPKLQDVIDPNASVAKNVVNVAINIAEKTSAATARATKQIENAVGAVQEIANDPTVKQVANRVVAPTAVGVAAVGTAVLVSWADILPLLRFLFLQPLLVLGRGKREKWGSVYNSLSKLPVDLALVRLINVDTGKLVQTKVTSSDGRYFFTVNAGRYRLEARKGLFTFPTFLLKDFQTDGNRLDVYHGEEIVVSDKGSIITANIPLDPVGQKLKTPLRLIVGKMMHRIQNVVSWIGLLVTLGSLYISPTWYMWVLLGVHLAMTFAFKRLSKPPVTKGWGIVYDEQSKKPLSKVVARLFDSKFNKLVATEITGSDGKYYFMAGDNQYYVSYDRDGYEPLKTEIIDLKGKEAESIAKDVNLKKK
ncbi:MAG: hypothetical protein WCT11_04235 [Candidatus Magasanikbacteria bacterium]